MYRKRNLVIALALLTAWSISGQAAQKRALSAHDLLALLAGGVYNARIVQLVRDRGITFVPTSHDLVSLRHAGANLALLNAVESARYITAQPPERINKSQRERQVAPPTSHPVQSIPNNTLTVRPATSIGPKPAPAIPAKPQETKKPPVSAVAVISPGTKITVTIGNATRSICHWE